MMKKVLVVFGTRPEAIKMCPVVIELKKSLEFNTLVCITGQHREMLEQVLKTFDVNPDYNLSIMKDSQTLFDITYGVMNGLKEILEEEKPDIVLVHGDTTTSFAAGLSSYYFRIPVGHIEAGLRTYNRMSPYPEEFNRQAIGIIADLHFSPTQAAKENLVREGKSEKNVFVTGNTVIDALRTTVKKEYSNEIIEWAKGSRLILLTAHRRENLGKPLRNMFYAIKDVIDITEDVKLIYPVHKNPAVRNVANEVFTGSSRIKLVEPMNVIDFHNVMDRAYLILTDSGGIQEEAPALGKPVLVMRNTTERPEGVQAGTLKLVGTDRQNIFVEFSRLLTDRTEYARMANATNPYGDGRASERIVNILREYLMD